MTTAVDYGIIEVRREVENMTYYQVLEIDKKASQEVIKAAFRALSMRYHPDKNPGDKQCLIRMQQINVAHSILSDSIKRAAYDQTLVFIPNQTYTAPNRPHTTSQPTPEPQQKYEPEQEPPPEPRQPLKTSFSNFLNNIPSGFVSFLKVVWSVIWPVTKILAKVTFWVTFGLIAIVGLCLCSGGGYDKNDYNYNRRY